MKKLFGVICVLVLINAIVAQQNPGSISGVVTDAITGSPIIGAMVVAEQEGVCDGRAFTNETGAYTIENLLPGNYEVMSRIRNYRPNHYPTLVVVLENQNTPNINFALVPKNPPPVNPGSISGIITDSLTGQPIGGAVVTAKYRSRYKGCDTTGADGSYIISNLYPWPYRVKAKARHYEAKMYPTPVQVVTGQTITNINFELRPEDGLPHPRGSISGTVINAVTQQPLANVTVMAVSDNNPSGKTVTAADGTFTIYNLYVGTYRVKANARGFRQEFYPSSVDVIANQNTPNINFVLQHR